MKNFEIKNGIAVIPQGTKEIEHFAFNECAELKSVIIPEGVTGIGVMAFRNCTNLAHIVIPNSVKKIGNFAFENCTSLEKITIPAGVQEIGKVYLLHAMHFPALWWKRATQCMIHAKAVMLSLKP